MIRFIRRWRADRRTAPQAKLARIVAETAQSFEVESYRKNRAAHLTEERKVWIGMLLAGQIRDRETRRQAQYDLDQIGIGIR